MKLFGKKNMAINILGYGVMSKQIAALLFLGGFNVNIWNPIEMNEDEIQTQIRLIKRALKQPLEGNLTFTTSLEDIGDNLTIESVIEDLEIKKQVIKSVKEKVKQPIFTNSSSFMPSELDEHINGLHFFNPIGSVKLVELYLVNNQKSEELDKIINFLKDNEYDIVKVNNNRGYLANYALFSEISSIFRLIEVYNYTMESINATYKHLYGNRNIFLLVDVIGIDVVYKILKNLNEKDTSFYVPKVLETALSKDILGKKNKTSIKQVLT